MRLRRLKAGRARADRGALWENVVFNELAKRLELLDEIRFWRSKSGAEVDFVVRRGERLVAIEVKAAEIVRPTVSRGAHSFLEAYRPACLGVVNASLRLERRGRRYRSLLRPGRSIGSRRA